MTQRHVKRVTIKRRDDEPCSYCYLSRAMQAEHKFIIYTEAYKDRMIYIENTTDCICGPGKPCRDAMCQYGIPLGGGGRRRK